MRLLHCFLSFHNTPSNIVIRSSSLSNSFVKCLSHFSVNLACFYSEPVAIKRIIPKMLKDSIQKIFSGYNNPAKSYLKIFKSVPTSRFLVPHETYEGLPYCHDATYTRILVNIFTHLFLGHYMVLMIRI